VPLQVDLQDLESIQRLAGELQGRSPRLNILVNNSGTGWAEPFEDYSPAGWDKVFDINVKAPFFLTKELLPALQAAATPEDPARVINIGSVSGIHTQHSSNNFAYAASKAGVHHLSGLLAGLLGPRHVTVNTIAPGPFPARMMQRSGRMEKLVATVPLGRAGTAEDAAGTALFLCSRAGAFVNGVVLPLDGGRLTNTFNE
jgi:NAD(P)-dependent dehydrogenase (short-subunit alcohol dehydrogenase family)